MKDRKIAIGLPAFAASPDQRGAQRKRLVIAGVLCDDDGRLVQDCTICDVSPIGARIGFARMTRPIERPFLIHVRDRVIHAAQLVWHNGREAGLSFDLSIPLISITDPKLAFLKRLWLARAAR